MTFDAGNKAVRDHAAEGKDLLLFQALGKSEPVRYLGRFACQDWITQRRPDRDGKDREAIVFLLKSLEADEVAPAGEAAPKGPALAPRDVDTLRKRAYAAAMPRSTPKATRAAQTVYERADAVRDYVLARAQGRCESCRTPAPFERKGGGLYLEPHHIRRVSDGGPDHPRWVGAVCPNCHREIHLGKDGSEKNTALEKYLGDIESDTVVPTAEHPA